MNEHQTATCAYLEFDEDNDKTPYHCFFDGKSCGGVKEECHTKKYLAFEIPIFKKKIEGKESQG